MKALDTLAPGGYTNLTMSATQLQKLSHKHEAILDWLLANPEADYGDCAQFFGISVSWMSIVVRSDLFQAELRRRRAAMEELQHHRTADRLHGILNKSLDATERALDSGTADGKFVTSTTELALKALGMIDTKQAPPASVTKNTLVLGAAVDPQTLLEAQQLLLRVQRPRALEEKNEKVIELPTPS